MVSIFAGQNSSPCLVDKILERGQWWWIYVCVMWISMVDIDGWLYVVRVIQFAIVWWGFLGYSDAEYTHGIGDTQEQ